ncbi:MAG: tRNA (adenosine(37)-N6)-threonylcarbamoyltransferase complex dimerization subunit type 1 TsaB [Bacteroidales bacterium]|nr:tRNA (adenosine(37)-N6)-threonylcarbamoyltransferase complex dimerization subunit type 1 TsaB [Bacteroidales bacterium]
MARILNIETSTDYCSVSISNDGKCTNIRLMQPDNTRKAAHSEKLAVFVKEVLDEATLKVSDLDAVALSGGPGSYTGLRIGASTSKGLCFGGDIPLISVNTLLVIAAMAKAKHNADYDLIVPMIDARRMEVYTMLTNEKLEKLSEVDAKIIDTESFSEHKGKKLLFCGNGAPKCKDVLAHEGFTFIDDIYPSAEFMGELSETAFRAGEFEDLVYYEPFYLKEFIATTSKKSLF